MKSNSRISDKHKKYVDISKTPISKFTTPISFMIVYPLLIFLQEHWNLWNQIEIVQTVDFSPLNHVKSLAKAKGLEIDHGANYPFTSICMQLFLAKIIIKKHQWCIKKLTLSEATARPIKVLHLRPKIKPSLTEMAWYLANGGSAL